MNSGRKSKAYRLVDLYEVRYVLDDELKKLGHSQQSTIALVARIMTRLSPRKNKLRDAALKERKP